VAIRSQQCPSSIVVVSSAKLTSAKSFEKQIALIEYHAQ